MINYRHRKKKQNYIACERGHNSSCLCEIFFLLLLMERRRYGCMCLECVWVCVSGWLSMCASATICDYKGAQLINDWKVRHKSLWFLQITWEFSWVDFCYSVTIQFPGLSVNFHRNSSISSNSTKYPLIHPFTASLSGSLTHLLIFLLPLRNGIYKY